MLFHNKYRIESARLSKWDYSSPGYYFVTICTHDRKCTLSQIQNEKVLLSRIGLIAKEEWEKTGLIRNNISIHEFVIMPNHVHGIIQIKQTIPGTDIFNPIITASTAAATTTTKSQSNQSHWKSGVLGAIIGQFKIQVSKRAHRCGFPEFKWQERFHDYIIRDKNELFRISQYIRNNPANWNKDKFRIKLNTVREDEAEYEKEIWMI